MFGLHGDNCRSCRLSLLRFSLGHDWSCSESPIVLVKLTPTSLFSVSASLSSVSLNLSVFLIFICFFFLFLPCPSLSRCFTPKHPEQYSTSVRSKWSTFSGCGTKKDETHLFLADCSRITAILQYLRERIQRRKNHKILSKHDGVELL